MQDFEETMLPQPLKKYLLFAKTEFRSKRGYTQSVYAQKNKITKQVKKQKKTLCKFLYILLTAFC